MSTPSLHPLMHCSTCITPQHAVHVQYTCSTRAVHVQYTCSTHAVHVQYPPAPHPLMHCITCITLAISPSTSPRSVQWPPATVTGPAGAAWPVEGCSTQAAGAGRWKKVAGGYSPQAVRAGRCGKLLIGLAGRHGGRCKGSIYSWCCAACRGVMPTGGRCKWCRKAGRQVLRRTGSWVLCDLHGLQPTSNAC